MSTQVGLNTSYLGNNNFGNNNLNNTIGATNTSFNPLALGGNSNNLFNFTPTVNNYNDDIMMSKLDSIFANSGMQQNLNNNITNSQMQYQNNNNNTNPTFSSSQQLQQTQPQMQNPNSSELEMNELDGYLAAKDKNIAYTENNNPYRKTNAAKSAGAILGFLAPVGGKIVKLFQGGKFKDLFKFKHLAIACPALALAGLGVGYLIDGYTNTKRAEKADENTMYKQTYTPQMNQQLA